MRSKNLFVTYLKFKCNQEFVFYLATLDELDNWVLALSKMNR